MDLLLNALNDDLSKPAEWCENVLNWNITLKELLFFYKFILNQFARSIQGQNLPGFWKTKKL